MRIAIVGAGGVGSLLAACLASASASASSSESAAQADQVIVVARGDHLRAMRADGLVVEGAIRAHARPHTVAHAAELSGVDLLLLTTKTFSTAQALADVDPRQVGMVASLQNGVLKDELLERHFGADKVIGCTTMLGGERTAPGHVRCMHNGQTFFGELSGEVSPRVRDIGRAFQAAGLGVQTTPRIRSLEWTKQVLQAANAPLCAVLGLSIQALYRGPAARLYYRIVLEAAAVARSLGVDLDDQQAWGGPIAELLGVDEPEALRLIHAFADRLDAAGATSIRVSMLQDREAGRQTEIEETAGHVVRLAAQRGIDTPYLDCVCQALRAVTAARSD